MKTHQLCFGIAIVCLGVFCSGTGYLLTHPQSLVARDVHALLSITVALGVGSLGIAVMAREHHVEEERHELERRRLRHE